MGKTYRRKGVSRGNSWEGKGKDNPEKPDAYFHGDMASVRDSTLSKEVRKRALRETRRQDIRKALQGEDFVESTDKDIRKESTLHDSGKYY